VENFKAGCPLTEAVSERSKMKEEEEGNATSAEWDVILTLSNIFFTMF
jgi:hypothetical protein